MKIIWLLYYSGVFRIKNIYQEIFFIRIDIKIVNNRINYIFPGNFKQRFIAE